MNLHRVETHVRRIDALLLIVLAALSTLLDDSRYFIVGVALSGLVEAMLWKWSANHLS